MVMVNNWKLRVLVKRIWTSNKDSSQDDDKEC
jgi:hypothetical protein